MSQTTKTTAEATYRERQRDVGALLDSIGQQIRMHAEFAEKDGITWCQAGDMGHYKEQLLQILMGLVGNDSEEESRKMIEDALAELKA